MRKRTHKVETSNKTNAQKLPCPISPKFPQIHILFLPQKTNKYESTIIVFLIEHYRSAFLRTRKKRPLYTLLDRDSQGKQSSDSRLPEPIRNRAS